MTAPTSLAPRKRPTPLRRLGWLLPLAAALTACTTLRPPAQVAPATPTSWQAPLPHDGQLQQLTNWWARTHDPVLVALIESAQRISPSLAQARSRVEQARATQTTARAALLPTLDAQASASRGVTPPVTTPATTAQAGASAAEATARAAQQRMQCDVDFKTLVALTGEPEPALRNQITAAPAPRYDEARFTIAALPVQVVSQRPDVYNAEREVAAASAEVGNAQAQRWPRLSLTGTVGTAWSRAAGTTTDLSTWSFGPLALSLPLLDGGRRTGQVDAARARYDEAVAVYQGRVRQAVSEVEQALVRLQSTAERADSARAAVQGYRTSFDATEARWRGGLASLVELEDARRTLLAAQTTLVALQHERQSAWVALYRAAGGGFDAANPTAPNTPAAPAL